MKFYILHYKRKGIFRSRRKNKLQTAFVINLHGIDFVTTVKDNRCVLLSLSYFAKDHNYLKSCVDNGIEIKTLPYVGMRFSDSQDFACQALGIPYQNVYDWSVTNRFLLD